MASVKLFIVVLSALAFISCLAAKPARYAISTSNAYEASLFRQNCAICHGREAEGRVLENGTKVPSLREGEFKALTEAAIYNQIANGGNGMLPFRDHLTERELKMLTGFVYHDLRGN
jgi:mono/diheme cytochrome c family protein